MPLILVPPIMREFLLFAQPFEIPHLFFGQRNQNLSKAAIDTAKEI